MQLNETRALFGLEPVNPDQSVFLVITGFGTLSLNNQPLPGAYQHHQAVMLTIDRATAEGITVRNKRLPEKGRVR